MTQCFSVSVVSQPTPKGPGLWDTKAQNQWSFGKTDGKPLADHWEGRGGRGGLAEHQHPTSSPYPPAAATAAAATVCPVPFSTSDGQNKPPELQQPSQYHSEFPETTSRANMYSGTDQKQPHTHISLANDCTQKRKRETGLQAALSLNSLTSNCKSENAIHRAKKKKKKRAFTLSPWNLHFKKQAGFLIWLI